MKGFIRGDNSNVVEVEKVKCDDGIYRYKTINGTYHDLENIVITESDKFLVVNYHSSPINVSHFQGTSRDRLPEFMDLVLNESVLELPEELTILTTFTDPEQCILYQQLKKHGINCLNSFDYLNNLEDGIWDMTKKIDMIREGLKHVNTEFTLICDGYDVYINTFDNIIPKFKKTGLRMFFNGTKNNFPWTHIDRVPYRDWRGEYRYFNAGCAIGYTEDFKKFYDDCAALIPKIDNPWGSEQYILRAVFSKYSELVNSDRAYMDFDWECNIFQTYVNSIVLKLYDKQEVYAVL